MQNKKQFIGILLSVLICVFLVFLGVYATTTISTNIVTDGVAALGTSTASTSYKLHIDPGTANAINLGLLDQDDQMGIYASVSADTDDTYVYGMYNDLSVGTGSIGSWRKAYGVYNNISLGVSLGGVVAMPSGIYNKLSVADSDGIGIQLAGIETISDNYSGPGVTQDASYIALKSGGANSQIRGSRTELFLKNDDDVQQCGYVNSAVIHRAGLNDMVYGYYFEDTGSGITGGSAYGLHITLDAGTWDIAYSIYIAPGSADSYFGSSIIIPTESLQVAHTASAAYSRFGSGTTGHSLDAANDLLITDDLEVDGTSFFDGLVSVSDSGILMDGGATITTGVASPGADCTVGSLYINTAGSAGAILHVCDETNIWTLITTD